MVITRSSPRILLLSTKRYAQAMSTAGWVCLICPYTDEVKGPRFSPLSVDLEPILRIIHDVTFAREKVGPAFTVTLALTPRHRASSAMCFVMCCNRCCVCDRRTVVARESSCAAWTSKTLFGRFWLIRQAHGVLRYVLGDHIVVDLRSPFGWWNSPGFRGVMVSALEKSHTHSTVQGADVSRQGAPRHGGFGSFLSPVILGHFLL